MPRWRFFRLVLPAVLLLLGQAATHADPSMNPCSIPWLRGKIVQYLVDDADATFKLPIYPSGATQLQLLLPVSRVEAEQSSDLGFTSRQGSVMLTPTEWTRGTIVVHSETRKVRFRLRTVDDPDKTVAIAFIRKRTEFDAGVPSVQVLSPHACGETGVSQPLVQLSGLEPAMAFTVEQVTERAMVTEALRGRDSLPTRRKDSESESEPGVHVTGYEWQVFGRYRILVFELHNRDPLPYRIQELKLLDEFKLKDHAGQIKVGLDEQSAPDGLLAVVGPREKVLIGVSVHEPDTVGNFMHLALREPGGFRPVTRDNVRTWVWEEPPDAKAGIVTLSAWGSYGAVWLTEDVGANRTAATKLEVLGARVTYAFNEYIHVEASAALARSGDAEFQKATLNAMTGDLVRNATLGRLQVGGLLRWGKTFMPTLRLGIGVQGASVNADFTPDGGSMTQSSSTEFGFFFSVGAGVDVWLVKGVLLLGTGLFGERISGVETLYRQSAGAGLHLGYAWKP